MKTPDFDAAARYTPFLDSARAVIAPEHASSERVVDLVQSARDIVIISRPPLERATRPEDGSELTMSSRCNEEVLSRLVPHSRAVVAELSTPVGELFRRVKSKSLHELTLNRLRRELHRQSPSLPWADSLRHPKR